LLQVQIKYFQNGDTTGNIGNRRHLCFCKWKGPILISNLDSTLNFKFRASFSQHFSVIVFDLCHLFHKKAGLQGFIKKFITPQSIQFLKVWPIFCAISEIFCVSYAYYMSKLCVKSFFKCQNQFSRALPTLCSNAEGFSCMPYKLCYLVCFAKLALRLIKKVVGQSFVPEKSY
jgi:hypothetical protein